MAKDNENMGPNQSRPTPPTYIPPTPRAGASPQAASGSVGPVMTRGSDSHVGHARDFAKAAGGRAKDDWSPEAREAAAKARAAHGGGGGGGAPSQEERQKAHEERTAKLEALGRQAGMHSGGGGAAPSHEERQKAHEERTKKLEAQLHQMNRQSAHEERTKKLEELAKKAGL